MFEMTMARFPSLSVQLPHPGLVALFFSSGVPGSAVELGQDVSSGGRWADWVEGPDDQG